MDVRPSRASTTRRCSRQDSAHVVLGTLLGTIILVSRLTPVLLLGYIPIPVISLRTSLAFDTSPPSGGQRGESYGHDYQPNL